MRVSKIEIKNLLGVEQLEIEPGVVTVISGKNAAGKTSVLESIKSALGGGHDGTLLRKGAEEGEVVLVLENGTTISKTVTAEKSTLSVRHPEFGKVSAGQSYINKLIDSLSVNPVEFLTAPKKQRVEALLDAIPIKVTEGDLDKAGVPNDIPIVDPESSHALVVIDDVVKTIYEQRTGINRSAKDKRSTARQMKETLPEKPANGDWSKKLKQLEKQHSKLTDETNERFLELREGAQEECRKADELCQKEISKLEHEANEKIRKIQEELNRKTQGWAKVRAEKIKEILERRDELVTKLDSEHKPKEKKLIETIAEARAMAEAETKAETTRRFIAEQEKSARGLDEKSKRMTEVLSNLEDLKGSLLKNLPIKGLEVKDGDVFIEGIPFDRANAAKRIELAIEVAKLRSKELGLVCVDNLETLDRAHFDAFQKMAEKSGLQFVISRVSNGALAVNAAGKEASNVA